MEKREEGLFSHERFSILHFIRPSPSGETPRDVGRRCNFTKQQNCSVRPSSGTLSIPPHGYPPACPIARRDREKFFKLPAPPWRAFPAANPIPWARGKFSRLAPHPPARPSRAIPSRPSRPSPLPFCRETQRRSCQEKIIYKRQNSGATPICEKLLRREGNSLAATLRHADILRGISARDFRAALPRSPTPYSANMISRLADVRR